MEAKFLVTVHYGMDDVPVRLFEDKAKAIEFADAIETPTFDLDVIAAREAHGIEITVEPICATVMEFIDGKPVRKVWVREYDCEDAA